MINEINNTLKFILSVSKCDLKKKNIQERQEAFGDVDIYR